jgi:hypothetical protein
MIPFAGASPDGQRGFLFGFFLMYVRRSINTKIWADPWIEELTPTEKLIWFYLLTSPYSNMLGIYEVSIKRISNETGIGQDGIKKALEGFERVGKAFHIDGYVYVVNWLKNQSMNPNMEKAARLEFAKLHEPLRIKLLEKGIESFESLTKGLPNHSEGFNNPLGKIEGEDGSMKVEEEDGNVKGEGAFSKPRHSPEQVAIFEKWQKWISENAPRINQLKQPLTIDEILRLREEHPPDRIQAVMIDMQNYQPLLKKYVNTNLTLKKWLKNENERRKPADELAATIERLSRLDENGNYYDDSSDGGV